MDRNEILVYRRDDDGDLRLTHRVDTRGRGTGVSLGNQGALALSKNGRRLYAVNAGSNDISVSAIGGNRPVLVQKLLSGGEQPISITLHDDLLYVRIYFRACIRAEGFSLLALRLLAGSVEVTPRHQQEGSL